MKKRIRDILSPIRVLIFVFLLIVVLVPNCSIAEDTAKEKAEVKLPPLEEMTHSKTLDFEVLGSWRKEAYMLEDNDFPEEMTLLGHRNEGIFNKRIVELSEQYIKKGKYSGKWDNHTYYPTISTRNIDPDWSEYNMVSFWVYSEVITNQYITFALHSDSDETPWKDFYYIDFKVDWEGWRQFEFPFESFGKYEEVAGWNKIDGIYLYTKIFDRQPNPYTVIYIDAMELSKASDEKIQVIAKEMNKDAVQLEAEKIEYITFCPEGFEKMTFPEYKRYINNKKEWNMASEERRKVLSEENKTLREKYNINEDNYTLSDLMDRREKITLNHEIIPFNNEVMNHEFSEIIKKPNAGEPIQYEAYFKNERAVYGFYPRYSPAPVSFDTEGRGYIKYGSTIIQMLDEQTGEWVYQDLAPFIDKYVKEELEWEKYRIRDGNFYDETTIRFDEDGDAYVTAIVQDSDVVGLLLHSKDKLKTWTVYRLPAPFTRFEKIDMHNKDALKRPPVILLDNFWRNGWKDRAAYILIPEKKKDGTLVIPEPVKYAQQTLGISMHSGDANTAVTGKDKIFVVYGIPYGPGVEKYGLDGNWKPEIPWDHPVYELPGFEVANHGTRHFHTGVPTYIVSYDIKTKKISKPVFIGTGGWDGADGHNWPAITIDSNGYLHVIINGHHDPLYYVSSKKPYSIEEWNKPEVVSVKTSYAALVIDNKDTLCVVTRNSKRGYRFDLTLSRKKAGQQWEEDVNLVQRFKSYYEIPMHKMSINPLTGRIFMTYYGQGSQICLFKDEFDAYVYTWPHREKPFMLQGGQDTHRIPLGTAVSQPGKYQFYNPKASEMTTLVSDDSGKTWRIAVTEDFILEK